MALSSGALEQKIEDVARNAEEAHGRNHERFDELKKKVDILEATVGEHGARILDHDRRILEQVDRLANQDRRHNEERRAPMEASQLRFSPQVVLWILMACGTLVAGPWFMNQGLRNDVASILTTMKTQQEIADRADQQRARDIDDLKKNEALHGIQINNLREEMIALKSKGVR
jgi:hypothetical protein